MNMHNHAQDRRDALEFIRTIAREPFLVLDTETTGLHHDDEIVSIAVLDYRGNVLIDTLVKPVKQIKPDDWITRHGITQETVKDAPNFVEVWQKVLSYIDGQTVLIYNAEYDVRMIFQSNKAHGREFGCLALYVDIMKPYAAICGEWNDHYKNYKFQKLPNTAHGARADCEALIKLINELAALEA